MAATMHRVVEHQFLKCGVGLGLRLGLYIVKVLGLGGRSSAVSGAQIDPKSKQTIIYVE